VGAGTVASEPVGDCRRVLGARGHDRGEQAATHDGTGQRVDQVGQGVRHCRDTLARWVVVGLDGHDPQHLARGDRGPDPAVDHLDGGLQRHRQERCVPVEGDELAGRDPALEGEAGPQPGDEHHEDARQQHLRGVQRSLDAGDPQADRPHPLGLLLVSAQEGLLAADAAQHPQPGDRVGAERREVSGLLALQGLPALQGADDEGQARDEHRTAEKDEPAERR
jgi:hypothetical protein